MFIYIFIYIVCGDRRILNAKGILERYGLITEQIVDAAKLDNITRVTSKYSCSMTGSSPVRRANKRLLELIDDGWDGRESDRKSVV